MSWLWSFALGWVCAWLILLAVAYALGPIWVMILSVPVGVGLYELFKWLGCDI